jgi:hypothetical protein
MRIRFSFYASLVALLASTLIASAAPKWTVLFDGKNADLWRGYHRDGFPSDCWVIENGTLRTLPNKPGPVDLITKETYGDFELELEWKVTPGANSGVIYHASEEFDHSWRTGAEYQVLDDEKNGDGRDPKKSASSLYALIAPNKDKHLKPVGDWNKARIVFKNNHVEHWLNGKKVVEYQWGSDELKERIKNSKFNSMPKFGTLSSGIITLQHHGGDVSFRKIRIRKLD